MSFIKSVIDFILHLDHHLAGLLADYGAWTYAILFAIIFVETGIVIFPFLPGDSLLFAAGSLSAISDTLRPEYLFGLLVAAAVIGDNLNYWVGSRIGTRAFSGRIRWLKPEHLERTREFYGKHGTKAVVLARFVPIVRTFSPFVAGVGGMTYRRFLAYDIFGGVLWVGLFVWGGYWFGQLPLVRDHFGLVILAIIGLSVTPILHEVWKARRDRPSDASTS